MPRLYFLHVPKTGGTSVRIYLSRQFPEDQQMLDKEFAQKKREFTAQGLDQPGVAVLRSRQYVQSHGFSLQEALTADPDALLFTMLRSPVDRLRSFYDYIRSYRPEFAKTFPEAEQRQIERVQSLSFEQFLSSHPRPLAGINGQVRRLLPGIDEIRATRGFDAAVNACREALDLFTAVLVTEEHVRSMRLLALMVGTDWEDAQAVVVNATATNHDEVPEAFLRVEKTVIEPHHREIVQRTDTIDWELYRLAREQFSRHCAEMMID